MIRASGCLDTPQRNRNNTPHLLRAMQNMHLITILITMGITIMRKKEIITMILICQILTDIFD